ncbi:DUF6624 domain-containing protein [Streptomyces sp. NPDC102441]|uniref:DUF6624 domain-containing protein n=1 Tax=Streptomyces sp. NPDC102441 TaxID=3366176 RepID=UPI00381DFD57
MTTPSESSPSRPDIARDLLARAESARAFRRTPAHRLAAMTPDELTQLRESDKGNAQALRHIVAKNRWPGRSLVGEEACRAALLIALRANHDPSFQRTLLGMLHEAARRGDASPAQWAHLHDRCLVHAERQQVYGTQHWFRTDGRLEPHPVADPDNLDARRAQVSLPPFAETAERLRRHHTDPSSLSPPASTCRSPPPTARPSARPTDERPAT